MALSKQWSISVAKDYLKFSAAHFLIFPDGTAERIHGHNYRVSVDLQTDLDPQGLVRAAEAIRTTDTFAKWSVRRVRLGGRTVTVAIVGLTPGNKPSLMILIIFWQLAIRQTGVRALKVQNNGCQRLIDAVTLRGGIG